MIVFPQCFDCRHLRRGVESAMECDAFPGGIPDPILLNEHDHHEPYAGDRGIRFEPIPPAVAADPDVRRRVESHLKVRFPE